MRRLVRTTVRCARTCARVTVRTLVRTPGWVRRHPSEVVSLALVTVVVLGTLDAYLSR